MIHIILVVLLLLAAPFHSAPLTNAFLNATGAIIGDFGSTGSQLFYFRFDSTGSLSTPIKIIPTSLRTEKQRPGISEMKDDLGEISRYLSDLLRPVDGWLARDGVDRSTTLVFFKATAGMRLLSDDHDELIKGAVDRRMRTEGFRYDGFEIISGQLEGVYSWLSTNSLLKRLDCPSSMSVCEKTAMVLDMGGASTQITFDATGTLVKDNLFPVVFSGAHYTLYTHSYMLYGVRHALDKYQDYLISREKARVHVRLSTRDLQKGTLIVQDFCGRFGRSKTELIEHDDGIPNEVTFVGFSNATKCRQVITRHLLHLKTFCSQTPCAMAGVYQPIIAPGLDIYGIGAFAEIMKSFEVEPTQRISYLLDLFDNRCARSSDFQDSEEWNNSQSRLDSKCFQLLYLYSVLVDGYRLAPERIVHCTAKFGDVEVGWSMGALQHELNMASMLNGWRDPE